MLAREETNEVETNSDGSQMLEKFKSEHLSFLNLSVAVCPKHLCLLGVLRHCSHLWILLYFFVFQLSETKIFTASNVSSVPLPAENVTITAGQR